MNLATIRRQEKREKIIKYILSFILIWFLITFVVVPVLTVIIKCFYIEGQLDVSAFRKIISSKRAIRSVKNSFLLAICLTFTANALGVFLVLVTEYFEVKGSRFLRKVYMTPLVMGGLVMNYGYLLVYGQHGLVTKILLHFFPNLDSTWFEGFPAVLFVMTFGCTHIHMLFLRNAIRGLDYHIIEAAKNLGSSPFQILKKVVFPSIKPVLLSVIIMTFQTGLGAFSAPVMVGGKDFQTISPIILTFANRPQSRDIASLLSVFLGIIQIALLYFLTRNEKTYQFLSNSKTQTKIKKQKINHPVVNVVIHFLAYAICFLYLLPFLSLIISSFMESQALRQMKLSLKHVTFKNYAMVFSDKELFRPLLTSVCFSLLASITAILLVMFFIRLLFKKKSKWVKLTEYLFYIPWLVPSLILTLGYIMAYDQKSPLLFGHSVIGAKWILPTAYMVVLLPNTLRYLKAAYFQIDPNLEDASRMLGASSFTSFRKVIMPSLLPTALSLFVLNFNSHLDDYDLSVFLYQPSLPTLGIAIRQNANPDFNLNAQAINSVYSVIVIILKSLAIYLALFKKNPKVNKVEE